MATNAKDGQTGPNWVAKTEVDWTMAMNSTEKAALMSTLIKYALMEINFQRCAKAHMDIAGIMAGLAPGERLHLMARLGQQTRDWMEGQGIDRESANRLIIEAIDKAQEVLGGIGRQ